MASISHVAAPPSLHDQQSRKLLLERIQLQNRWNMSLTESQVSTWIRKALHDLLMHGARGCILAQQSPSFTPCSLRAKHKQRTGQVRAAPPTGICTAQLDSLRLHPYFMLLFIYSYVYWLIFIKYCFTSHLHIFVLVTLKPRTSVMLRSSPLWTHNPTQGYEINGTERKGWKVRFSSHPYLDLRGKKVPPCWHQ
jgi:hypothetical protein